MTFSYNLHSRNLSLGARMGRRTWARLKTSILATFSGGGGCGRPETETPRRIVNEDPISQRFIRYVSRENVWQQGIVWLVIGLFCRMGPVSSPNDLLGGC